MRWTIAVIAAAGLVLGGCATQDASTEPSVEPVGGARADEVQKPWAEGPVDSTTANRREGRHLGEPTDAQKRRSRSAIEQSQRVVREDGLAAVFPETTLSLDFTNADVRRVFRVFQEKSQVDLVLAPEVEGRVTVSTSKVRLVDAFRAVVDAAKLSWTRKDGVLLLKPAE